MINWWCGSIVHCALSGLTERSVRQRAKLATRTVVYKLVSPLSLQVFTRHWFVFSDFLTNGGGGCGDGVGGRRWGRWHFCEKSLCNLFEKKLECRQCRPPPFLQIFACIFFVFFISIYLSIFIQILRWDRSSYRNVYMWKAMGKCNRHLSPVHNTVLKLNWYYLYRNV